MSIRLNKALRELNIGLQTAVEFLEKRKDLGEVKAATYIGSAVILTVTVTNLWGWLVYPAEMLKNQWFLFITSLCPGNYVFAVSGSCSYCDSTGLLPDYLQVKHCSGFEFEFWQSNNSILD